MNLMFLTELISFSTDSFLLGGESADWGLCAGSEPAPEAASSRRAGGRAAEAGGENRFRGPGGRVGKNPFFLTSPVFFFVFFIYLPRRESF